MILTKPIVTLDEVKGYLRLDGNAEDDFLTALISSADQLCTDIARTEITGKPTARIAVLYAIAYLYEHREEADYKALTLTLRALLFGVRQEGF